MLNAQDVKNYTKEQIWSLPQGLHKVKFNDGKVVTITSRRLILTWYYWRLFTLSDEFIVHSNCILPEGKFNSRHHLELASKTVWAVYSQIGNNKSINIWTLSEDIYRATNDIFNDVGDYIGEYVTTFSLKDIYEFITHPGIMKAKETYHKVKETHSKNVGEAIEDVYDTAFGLMKEDLPELRENEIRKGVAYGTIDRRAVAQTVGMRGFVKDINGETFQHPIDVGYAEGLSSLYDQATESCSSKRALSAQGGPLKESEYFNRRIQLLMGTLGYVREYDCGTKRTLTVTLRPEDLDVFAGKNYYLDDGTLGVIAPDSFELIGKVIRMRSSTTCSTHDPRNVCHTCLGWNSVIIPPKDCYGHVLSIGPCSQISQGILSVKHLEISMEPVYLELDTASKKVLEKDRKKQWQLKLKPLPSSTGVMSKIKNAFRKKTYIKLHAMHLQLDRINNVLDVDNPETLSPERISDLRFVDVCLYNSDDVMIKRTTVNLEISNTGSSFTREFLKYAKKTGWDIIGEEIVFDMREWDFSNPVITTPRRNEDLIHYLNRIKGFLLGSDDKRKDKDIQPITSCGTVEEALFTFLDILRPPKSAGPKATRIDINISEIEVIIRALMCKDPTKGDFRLPSAGDSFAFSTIFPTVNGRSIAGSFAYERQHEQLKSPVTYLNTERTGHVFDPILG